MRIYEGSPRQDWEEVLRSVGDYVDHRGMRDVIFLETATGFILQGTVVSTESGSAWGESMGRSNLETIVLDDDKVAAFMDEAAARRGKPPEQKPSHYEQHLRVLGRVLDEHHPHDVFFFEVDGAYIARVTQMGQSGLRHELIEFTAQDVADLIARAPALRRSTDPAKPD